MADEAVPKEMKEADRLVKEAVDRISEHVDSSRSSRRMPKKSNPGPSPKTSSLAIRNALVVQHAAELVEELLEQNPRTRTRADWTPWYFIIERKMKRLLDDLDRISSL